MAVVTRQALLEAGVHFGHVKRKWNPKMAPYIFTVRAGTHIIDLAKTMECIEVAYKAMVEIVKNGGKVLFVGTRKQSQDAVREEAIRTGMMYVDHRWLGGTLTNFKTIKQRIKYLESLYKMEADGDFTKLPKKEVLKLLHKRARLEKFLSGIKEMKKIPDAVFVVDPSEEINTVLEAKKLGIPIFGLVDTNCDPDDITYVIPGNDDAIKSVKLITSIIGNAIIEASGGVVEHFADSDTAVVADVKVEDITPNQDNETTNTQIKEESAVTTLSAEDLSLKTVKELQTIAKDLGLTGFSKLKKDEIIALILGA